MPGFMWSDRGQLNPAYAGQIPEDPAARDQFFTMHPDAYVPAPSAAPPAVTPDIIAAQQAKLAALGAALNPGQGTTLNLGSAGLPGMVAAPKMVMPDYSKADAAFQLAKPQAVSAPQYVQANYQAADKMYADAKPAGLTDTDKSNDMWGKILSGAVSGFTGGNFNGYGIGGGGLQNGVRPGWAGILGALGGYGSALENRTKMSVDAANRTSDYLIKDANYESGKAKDIADTTNQQQTGDFQASSTNNTNLTGYARALGGYESGKAEDLSNVQNEGVKLGYQAATRNADIRAQKTGVKVIGQNKNEVLYSFIDKDGNMNIGSKPISSFSGANGLTGGKMAGNDPGAAGMETLIHTLRASGQLPNLLGPDVYAKMVAPAKAYSDPTGALGGYNSLGDKGKAEAFTRAQAEEDANIANLLYANPQLFDKFVNAVSGGQ